mgnify:CR=1 FL=1
MFDLDHGNAEDGEQEANHQTGDDQRQDDALDPDDDDVLQGQVDVGTHDAGDGSGEEQDLRNAHDSGDVLSGQRSAGNNVGGQEHLSQGDGAGLTQHSGLGTETAQHGEGHEDVADDGEDGGVLIAGDLGLAGHIVAGDLQIQRFQLFLPAQSQNLLQRQHQNQLLRLLLLQKQRQLQLQHQKQHLKL